ncbi:MAG: HAMP domain-containing protein [Actinobacteria bacterium]|nr:HAMP domain-containing protein [Actinomycetota bacterium]
MAIAICRNNEGMRHGLRRRMFFASTGLAALIGAAFVILIVAIVNLRSQSRTERHSEEVIATANKLEKLVLDLQTGARGYVISHHGVYLKPWQNANAAFPEIASNLLKLVKSNPTQTKRAKRIIAGIKDYEVTWADLVILTAAENPSKARALVITGVGEQKVDLLRTEFDTFVAAEQMQSDMLRKKADRQENYAIAFGAFGLGSSLLLIGVFGFYVAWRVVGPIRRVAGATQRLAAGDLTERVLEGGRDEIGELGRNFNRMAESIETAQHELAGQNKDLARLTTVLRGVLDSTVDGIALTDLEGNIQIVNRPLQRFVDELGLEQDGNVVSQLLSAREKLRDPENFQELMERLREHPDEPSADEFEFVDPYRVFVEFTAPVLTDEGELLGRIWTLREVTQERELDRLKDEFVATVSRELRTPLTSMMGFLEMLREGEAGSLTPEQSRFLGIVYRSSERLQRLVGDLLFVARLDASGLQLHLEDGVRLDEVVTDSIESSSALARSKDIELTFDCAEANGVAVRGDKERLAQVTANLLSNALKFTPSGGKVAARVFVDGEDGVLEIEDTGIGIPEAEQERLFSRFFRSSTATNQAIPGTGLGLAIARAIAEAHGGSITVKSRVGEGTCFRVVIPL